MKTENFGEHFMLDGYMGDREKLNDKNLVLKNLNELCSLLGMRKLADPQVYFAEGNNKKDPGGWSGMVIITESHISIHTFPKKGFLSADIYSCKNGMDLGLIENYLKVSFGLKEIEVNFVKRGTKYPIKNIY